MKLRTTLALAVAALALGVPVAGATPDGYQPQLKSVTTPDAIDRYLRNNTPAVPPDAIDRYLRNNTPAGPTDALDRYLANNAPQQVEATGAATHPDSSASRPIPMGDVVSVASDGRDWTTGAFGALGGALLAILAIVGASAIRERRRLALR